MKPGQRIRITTHNNLVFEGTLLEGATYTLKLDDGYNVGVAERNVKDIKELPAQKKSAPAPQAPKTDASLPNITLLHTGGTIASKVDYETGGVSNKITPDELLALYPELQDVAHVSAVFLNQMSSDDMRFAHYNQIITAVKDAVADGVKGIIVTQGTDTLHYTAAALHYALQGIRIPVVLVGSQRSADRGSSDAATNLLGAARFITTLAYPGVFIAMHASSSDDEIAILRGVNARKNHTSRRDAFQSINIPVVATITSTEQRVGVEPPQPTKEFSPTLFKEDLKVGMAYMHPHFFAQALAPYTSYDGLVLLGTGLGHAPINTIDDTTKPHEDTKKAIFSLAKKMPVVMTSQCLHGRVNLQVYSPGRILQDAGIIGHDSALTPETAFIKLSWLLSQGIKQSELAAQFAADFGDSIPRVEEGVYE